jgi:phosphoribosylamine--glycine ligase
VRVLILGSGAKEHVIAWSFSKSRRISGLFVAPGNAGTAEIAENLPDIPLEDPAAIVDACRRKRIDYVFAASARAQVAGAVDALKEAGIAVFGAPTASARLEGDRVFAKEFMQRHGVPTEAWDTFSDYDAFSEYLTHHDGHLVVKRNKTTYQGHASLDSADKEELLEFAGKALKDGPVIVEPYNRGYNVSLFAFTDGTHYTLLPPTSDYTRSEENEEGLITSGMGAVCPIPVLGKELYSKIVDTVVEPTFQGMRKEGLCYKGVFFFSLLVSGNNAVVTSYHVRFGDPEAQVLLPLIKSDFGNIMEAINREQLQDFTIRYSGDSAVGVVIASEGYPRNGTGHRHPVRMRKGFSEDEALVFHGSTSTNGNGELVTQGGRCFTIVGFGENLLKAHHHAYRHLDAVDFKGAWSRTDIGTRFINH